MPQKSNPSYEEQYDAVVVIDNTVLLIYKYVVFTVLRQAINIFGIVTNIINIICFVKHGFKDSINVSLLGLSLSDLCSLVCMACLCIFLSPAFDEADLPFESVDVTYLVFSMPHFAFTRVSSCITAMITMEKCISIVAPLKVKNIVCPRRTGVAVVCIFVVFTFSATPVYVVNELRAIFSSSRNKTLIGLVSRSDKEHVEKFTFLVNNFFVPFGAFAIVALCTAILSTQLRKHTEWRKEAIANAQADRISCRNKKIVKMVVTISTLFIVCFIPSTIAMLVIAFQPDLAVNGKYVNISILILGFSYVLEGINSSVNIFIYYHMSSKYRDAFRELFT